MNKLHSDKKVLVGITGSIAAFKAVVLVRELVKQGYQVKVMVTPAALKFVTALTLQTISQNKVYTEQFDLSAEYSMGHIELAKWADLIMICPCTANTVNKLANGYGDNILTTVALAKPQKTRLYLATAMNMEMYNNPATQVSIQTLRSRGVVVLDSAKGEQACGDCGNGRMLEVEELVAVIKQYFSSNNKYVGLVDSVSTCQERKKVVTLKQIDKQQLDLHEHDFASYNLPFLKNLQGKRILITAGPTREMIDPVRYITNHSSGKMGIYIASLAQKLGANVTLVTGPVYIQIPEGIRTIAVESAEQMNNAVNESLIDMDIFIGCAAVGDYKAKEISTQKIKKADDNDELTIILVKNPDILYNVSHSPRRPKYVVGFAAETNDVANYARNKVKSKGCDMICANDVSKENQGWNSEYNHLVLYTNNDDEIDLGYERKEYLSIHLLHHIAKALVEKEEQSK